MESPILPPDDCVRATSRLVVVANRLPVHRSGDSGEWRLSPGGLVTGLAPIMNKHDGVWVGWHGLSGRAPAPFRAGNIDLRPIGLSDQEIEFYYDGMSNSTLWPLYHGALRSPVIEPDWWPYYVAVNRRFAEAAAEAASPSGTIWVHDYHLQLVPTMVRELRADVAVSFFFHTPFPPSELLLRLPWREELISGALGADVVGLQTPRDVDNFLSVCTKVLPSVTVARTDSSSAVLRYAGREISVGAYPVSIDVAEIGRRAQDPVAHKKRDELRARLGHPDVVLLGVDRLDYTKGIDARLEAFLMLLRNGDLDPADVVFVQVASPSRENVEDYRAVRLRVERQVSEINGEFSDVGRPVVHYIHRTLSFDELLPLYLAADVMLVTPYRDGMNLVAKEYVTSRYDNSGVLLLSEFAGAAQELGDAAVLCNPFDQAGLARRLLEATTLDSAIALKCMSKMRQAVRDNDAHNWADSVLSAGRWPARAPMLGVAQVDLRSHVTPTQPAIASSDSFPETPAAPTGWVSGKPQLEGFLP